METLNRINSLLDRIENRVGGSAQIPFINPCPSGEEWLELRRLLNSLSNPSDLSVQDIPGMPGWAWIPIARHVQMADLFWEYGVKDTILNMLVYTDAPTFSLAKAWAGANSVRRYEVVARPTGEWRAVSGPQKPLEDQSGLHRKLAEALEIIDELNAEIVSLNLELDEVYEYGC